MKLRQEACNRLRVTLITPGFARTDPRDTVADPEPARGGTRPHGGAARGGCQHHRLHRAAAGRERGEDCFPALGRRPDGPWLAHRLDADTAGCLVVALRKTALVQAQACFAEGRAAKTYWAVVSGGPAARSAWSTARSPGTAPRPAGTRARTRTGSRRALPGRCSAGDLALPGSSCACSPPHPSGAGALRPARLSDPRRPGVWDRRHPVAPAGAVAVVAAGPAGLNDGAAAGAHAGSPRTVRLSRMTTAA